MRAREKGRGQIASAAVGVAALAQLLSPAAHGATVRCGATVLGTTGRDGIAAIEQTMDGGLVAAGAIGAARDLSAPAGDAWVTKFRPNGSVHWQRSYGGASGADWASAIRQAHDGGFVVAGATSSYANDATWVVRTNSDGTVRWQQAYVGYYTGRAYAVDITSDGGAVVAGYTAAFGSDRYDAWVLKLRSDGAVSHLDPVDLRTPVVVEGTWQMRYGGSGLDSINAIRQTSDGGYIAAGYTGSVAGQGIDALVLKLAPDGSVQWQRHFGVAQQNLQNPADGWDSAASVVQTRDGGYAVAGSTTAGAGGIDAWVLKLRPDGSVEWQKAYGGDAQDDAFSLGLAAGGGYIVGGRTSSFDAGVTGRGFDAWVLDLDAAGGVVWATEIGGARYDRAYSVAQMRDGSVAAGGFTSSFGAGSIDAWVLRLPGDGRLAARDGFDLRVTATPPVVTETAAVTANGPAGELTAGGTWAEPRATPAVPGDAQASVVQIGMCAA